MRYRSVGSFAFGTLTSRLFGLVREGVIAYLLGASKFSDALYVAFRIPNLLRDLLGEGAIQTAFVPTYVRAREEAKNPKGFLSAVLLFVILVSIFVVVIGIIFAPYLVSLFAFGFTKAPEKFSLTVSLTRITFPFLFVVAIAAFIGGILNTFRKFFIPAVSPTLFNVGVILLGLLAAFLKKGPIISSYLLAIGIVTGGILQAVFQLPYLKKINSIDPIMKSPKTLNRNDFHHPYLGAFFKLLLPVVLSTALTRVSLFVNTLIASFMEHGAISYLNYAYRVMHLPLGLFGVGIATVILPDLSGLISKGEKAAPELKRGLQLGLFLTLPTALFLAVDSKPLIALLFQRGSFGMKATDSTARALLFYTIGIPFFSVSRILLNYYYAQHRIRVPNLVFLSGALVNIIVALSLSPYLDFPALALATSSAGITQALILYLMTKKETGKTLIDYNFLVRQISLLFILLLVFWSTRFISIHPFIRLFLDAILGAFIYFAFSYVLGIKEMKGLLKG